MIVTKWKHLTSSLNLHHSQSVATDNRLLLVVVRPNLRYYSSSLTDRTDSVLSDGLGPLQQ